MASNREYLDYIMEQLSADARFRAMMGEYLIYYRGKIIGGIYDNRFLVKDVPAARELMPEAAEEIPYDGAKPMLMIDNVDNKEFLARLLEAIYCQLPENKRKKG